MMNIALLKLDQELAEMREFLALLTSEQQLLLNNESDTLLVLSETKAQAAKHLKEMAESRRKALLSQAFPTMETWVSKHAPHCQKIWREIRKLASQAQQLNTTNGELIQSKLRFNQQAMRVLFNASPNAAGVYGPNGHANIGSSGRHLGSG
jgi:flagellar biosynthesis protein FlgN